MLKRIHSAYPKDVLIIALVAMIALAGFSFVWPLTSVYVTTVLHRPMTTAGVVLSIEACAGIGGSLSGGWIFDRFSAKWAMVSSGMTIVFASLLLSLTRSWPIYLVGFILITYSIGVLGTVTTAAMAVTWPDGGRRPFNLLYVVRNVGVAGGSALGGFLAMVSFSTTFLATAICFALVAITVLTGLDRNKPGAEKKNIDASLQRRGKAGHRTRLIPILVLGFGALLDMIGYMQWQTTIPIYMTILGFHMSSYSLLWTVNGILIIVCQPVMSVVVRFLRVEWLQFAVGQSLFVLSFLVLLTNHSFWVFLSAMFLMTWAEMIIWPAIPAKVADISPSGRQGFYQGILNVCNYCGRLIGPVLGTSIFESGGATYMLIMACVFYTVAYGAFVFPRRGRREMTTSQVGVDMTEFHAQ